MDPRNKSSRPRRPAGWPKPGELSDDDVAGLRSETAAIFGDDAAATIFDTLGGPLPREAIEALRAGLGPGMPSVDDFLASHDELRSILGDKRPRRMKTLPDR